MKAISFDRYVELLDTAPAFPMTEADAARVLADCGYIGADRQLAYLRESGQVTAAKDAWGRAAFDAAAASLADTQCFKFDVFSAHGMGTTYEIFMVAYLAACGRVLEEYPFADAAGMFGDKTLVPFGWFVVTFFPPRGDRDGFVKFELADDVRAKLDAKKVARTEA